MAFNINAHVILSGPKNIKAVTKNIQKQLTGVTATVDIKVPKNIGRSLGTLSKRLQTLHKDLRNVQSSASGATSALRDLGTQVQSLNSSTAGLAKSQSRVQASLQKTGKNVAIIISDTFGRPFRLGQTDVAIGIAGLEPILDYNGKPDTFGKIMQVTAIAVADEICSTSELVMGKVQKCPIAVIRNYNFSSSTAKIQEMLRSDHDDLFR